MLYAGLDLSRKRLDFHLLDNEGATVEVGAAAPDADGLYGLIASPPRASWPATPVSAHASTSRASPTAAAHSPSRDPATCVGRSSRPPSTPAPTPPTTSATNAPSELAPVCLTPR